MGINVLFFYAKLHKHYALSANDDPIIFNKKAIATRTFLCGFADID
jgi:hypothetical protein